jgi:diketogulonate reductase-like aldo/keto reductase
MSRLTTVSGKPLQNVIYGTAYKRFRTARMLTEALDTGYRAIDSANWSMLTRLKTDVVKNFSEDIAGRALAECRIPREDLFLQSKFVSMPFHDPLLPPYPPYEEQNIEEACKISLYKSLENLRTQYLDSFLINAPDLTAEPMERLLNVLHEFKQLRRIRYSGICNVTTVEIMEYLHKSVPEAIQIVQNPLHSVTDPEYKVQLYCRNHGIHYNTFYTLVSGDRIIFSDTLDAISQVRNTTPQIVFLQFCIQLGVTPLIGPRSTESLVGTYNTLVQGTFEPLSRDHMIAITRLMAEQSVINIHRSSFKDSRRRQELEKQRVLERRDAKMYKEWEEKKQKLLKEEDEIIEAAKRRIKLMEERGVYTDFMDKFVELLKTEAEVHETKRGRDMSVEDLAQLDEKRLMALGEEEAPKVPSDDEQGVRAPRDIWAENREEEEGEEREEEDKDDNNYGRKSTRSEDSRRSVPSI